MDVFLHLLVLCTLGALAASVAALWLRNGALAKRLNRLDTTHTELRNAARAFIGASRESPPDVCLKLDRAVRAFAPTVDSVLFLERSGGELACTYASGARAEYFRGVRLSLERDPSVLTEAAGSCRRVSSATRPAGAIPGDRGFLAVPIIDDGHCAAVFYAASSTAPSLTNEDEIVTLADLATPAYKVALDRQSDRQKATVDSLTGLLTPRAFRAELANLISIARAQADARLCLLYIDTDHFKLCNDTLGHAAGDEVLRSLARLFAGLAGPEALVSRNGGDEFCILFHSMTKSDAVRRAERIRGAVEAYPFGRALGTPLPRPLTTSIGVASYPSDASGWEELLERADQAMYHSKRRGRNRVSFFGLAGNAVDFSDGPAATVP